MWWVRENGSVQAAWQSKSKSNDTICTYMHIYIYIGWNWATAAMYTTGVLLRYGFFRSASTIQRCRGFMGKRQRKRNRHKGGWVHRSETRARLSTPPDIYIIIRIIHIFGPIRKIRERREISPEGLPPGRWTIYSLYVASVPWQWMRGSSVKPRVRVALMSNRCEYIWRYNSGFDCRSWSGTVAMLMLRLRCRVGKKTRNPRAP